MGNPGQWDATAAGAESPTLTESSQRAQALGVFVLPENPCLAVKRSEAQFSQSERIAVRGFETSQHRRARTEAGLTREA